MVVAPPSPASGTAFNPADVEAASGADRVIVRVIGLGLGLVWVLVRLSVTSTMDP